jgi:dihydrofolate reductase
MSCIASHGVSDQARHALVAMTSATAVLLGRRTYEGFGGYWPSVAADDGADPRDRAFARWLNDVDKVVFSTMLHQLDWDNARLAEQGPVETVATLRETDGGDIRVLASQSILRQLLDADEVDRLELTLAPEVAGGGDRLFNDDVTPSRWSLADAVPTDTGPVQLSYRRTFRGDSR